jgi:preprotein translocase subunit SecG
MLNLILILAAFVCILLIIVVLVQNPKGGGIDPTLGGSSANQMLGAARSADFIEKATWYLALALFILCILSTFFVGGSGVEGFDASQLPSNQ